MATLKNIAVKFNLSHEEVKDIKREVRLDTYASIFNNYMKMDSAELSEEIPQMMLTLIHNEFDDEREQAEWENDHLFLYATDFELALEYVREHIDSVRIEKVQYILATQNMELADVDEDLDTEIYDLMEEYGANNDLAEGWWLNEGTTEDVIVKL